MRKMDCILFMDKEKNGCGKAERCQFVNLFFTARCTIVQSTVMQSHVVFPSVSLSVSLSVTSVDLYHIG